MRTALVTGSNRGIGLAIAKWLSSCGDIRVLTAARLDEDAHATAINIGHDAVAVTLDLSDPIHVEQRVQEIESSHGPIDILVNNAAILTYGSVVEINAADLTESISVNAISPFSLIRALGSAMKARGWGRIVSVASTAARTAVADHAAYCASKTGLLGLTRAVALEGAPHGVACNAVSPTWVETDMLRNSAAVMAGHSGRSQAEEIAAMAAANPQNRLVQPEEIAALITFLCRNEALPLTMEDIQVNAGAHW